MSVSTRSWMASLLAFAILVAVIPLHDIYHHHYFVKADLCGSHCSKHLKPYSKPCCKPSEAVFIATIPTPVIHHCPVRDVIRLFIPQYSGNYFQFFHFVKNKAPPASC